MERKALAEKRSLQNCLFLALIVVLVLILILTTIMIVINDLILPTARSASGDLDSYLAELKKGAQVGRNTMIFGI